MRKEILKLLRSKDGFVSGEYLAKNFEVSRTAIWKHIQELRKVGYKIDSVVKSGYSFQSAPDILFPEEIQHGLNTKIFGQNIFFYETIDSTNEQAKKIIAENPQIDDGFIVVAEEQTSGKGRLDRKFFSPAHKSILFSIVIRPEVLPQDAPKFTLAAAVAIAKVMRQYNLPIGIKWPNDILFENKKLVGILTEMDAEISRVHCIIIGCGINFSITEFPDDIKDIATSIELVKRSVGIEENFSRVKFFQSILEEFELIYLDIKKNGFKKIFKEWKKLTVTLDKPVKVIPAGEPDKTFEGIAIDIDSNGALIVKKSDGSRIHVLAGDVSIRETT